MIGYQIWQRCSELVDEYDPDETRVEKCYPYTDIYLNEDEAKQKLKELNEDPKPYSGNPIQCYSETLEFYMRTVNIK